MGCGCVSHQAGRPSSPQQFATGSDAEFLRSLSHDELKDKKRLLAYYHLYQPEGQFRATDAFKELVRQKGVPDRYRWQAWKALTGWSSLVKPGMYERLMQREPERKVMESVAKDLDRTFPKLDEFDEEKKRQLAAIVRAFACVVPQVGYCQGMNFIIGFLLLACGQSHHEDAFFLFFQMMVKYRASLLFSDGLPLLKLFTFQFKMLLTELNPEVAQHFTCQGITPELYLTKWMLTIFTQPLAFESAARVWDLIVCDGLEALVLLCLATVRLLSPRLLLQDTEGILELLSLRKDTVPPSGSDIVQTALSLKLPGGLQASLSKYRGMWAQECGEDAVALERAESAFCRSDLLEQPWATQAPPPLEDSLPREPSPFPAPPVADPIATPEMQTNSINAPAGSPIGTLPSRCLDAGPCAEPFRQSPEADGHPTAGSLDAIIVGGNTSPYIVAAETKMDIVNARWPNDCITKVSAAGPLSLHEGGAEAERSPAPHYSSEGNVRPELHLCLTPRPSPLMQLISPISGQEFEGDSRSTSCDVPSPDAIDEALTSGPGSGPPAIASSPHSTMTPNHGMMRRPQDGGSPVSTATAPAALGENWKSSDSGQTLAAHSTSHANTLPPLSLQQGADPSANSLGHRNVDEGPSRAPKASPWTSPASCRQSPLAATDGSDARLATASPGSNQAAAEASDMRPTAAVSDLVAANDGSPAGVGRQDSASRLAL